MREKVLVTGSEGFIGSHLTECLLERGFAVRAFVLYNSFNSWGWLESLPKEKLKEIEVFAGDVRDPACARRALKGMDTVFHLAALIGIPFSYHSPGAYIDTNVRGTLNILEAGREYETKRIVVTSTSEVYGTAQYTPIDEKHPLRGQSPYAASKIGADKLAESFHRSFNLPVVIARPFNTYGPRQSCRAVIPTIITQLLSGKNEIRLGALQPTRDFNYVRDICNGMIALSQCEQALGKEVNIGSGSEISIQELAGLLKGVITPQASVICQDARKRPHKSEVERLVCDNSLMQGLTGWKPQVNLKDGLFTTIEWFKDKENLRKYKGDIYNI